ncbi:hypothetical protein HYH08_02245 [Bradyrhizobium sp. BR 10289]|nr:hypothetical protein [Bradyrhizobium sp. BR 10289]
MGNRTAKFISALVGSIIAGAPLAAVSQNAPSAASTASDCLASPKGAAPQGQHWFYRLDRTTKRKCWYLRAEGAKAPQATQATADARNTDPTTPSAVQNARAEYIAPQTAPNVTAPAPAATSAPPVPQQPSSTDADNDAQQPAVATRWPDASATTTAPAPVAAATQPSAKPAKPAAPVALAAAEAPADKQDGSLQMLLLVIGGALALAGLLASVIYRFAGGRVRLQTSDQRRGHWDDWDPQDLDDSRAPWLNAAPAETPRAQPPQPVDFDAVRPQDSLPQASRPQAPHIAAFSDEIGRIAAQSRSPHLEAAQGLEHDLEQDLDQGLDEADIFNGEFEIETSAPRLAANDAHDEEFVEDASAGHDEDDREKDVESEDAVDIDVVTAMLEKLAQQGPRLSQSELNPEAVLVDLARSPRAQSAARA